MDLIEELQNHMTVAAIQFILEKMSIDGLKRVRDIANDELRKRDGDVINAEVTPMQENHET
jgi:uncharacterized protein YeeX (DUF496 family)